MVLLSFDEFGKVIRPAPRPCDRRDAHTDREARECCLCNPCFCIRGGSTIFRCVRCVKTTLGGAKRARELGVDSDFCDHGCSKPTCAACKGVAPLGGVKPRWGKPRRSGAVPRCRHQVPLGRYCQGCRSFTGGGYEGAAAMRDLMMLAEVCAGAEARDAGLGN